MDLHDICVDPPKEFSSENLGVPVISFMNDENVEVTLLCKVKVLNGIQNWKTYLTKSSGLLKEHLYTKKKYAAISLLGK